MTCRSIFLGGNPWEISGKNMRYGRFPINGGRIVVDIEVNSG
jgi:hypothetical protein